MGEGVPGLPRVDNYAHGGGLAFGLLCGFALFGAQPNLCCCAPQLPGPLLVPATSTSSGSGPDGSGAHAFGGAYSSAATTSRSASASDRDWSGGFVDASSGVQTSPLSKLFSGLPQASNIQKITMGLLVVSFALLVLLLMATPPNAGYLASC